MKNTLLLFLLALSLFPVLVFSDDQILGKAYSQHKSNIQVLGGGEVVKVLSDDIDGSRHQRFIIKLVLGQTLLIAHNIDFSSKIPLLREGDILIFMANMNGAQRAESFIGHT